MIYVVNRVLFAYNYGLIGFAVDRKLAVEKTPALRLPGTCGDNKVIISQILFHSSVNWALELHFCYVDSNKNVYRSLEILGRSGRYPVFCNKSPGSNQFGQPTDM